MLTGVTARNRKTEMEKRLNVLHIMADQLAAPALAAYGNEGPGALSVRAGEEAG